MKLFRILICAVFLLGCIAVTGLFAQDAKLPEVKGAEARMPEKTPEEKVTGSVTLGVFNKYIFRGYELSRHSVVIQPSVTVSYKGFSVTYWGNVDSKAHDTHSYFPTAFDKEGEKWFNETDLTLSYTKTFDKFSLTGGYIYYNTKYAEETEEFFFGGTLNVISKPTLTVYRDVSSYPGTYLNLSFSHSVPVYKDVTLDLGASAGYMIGQGHYWKTFERSTGDYTGSKYNALHDGMVKAGFTIPITKALSFQPVAQYWFPLSGDAKKKIGSASYNPNGYLGTVFVGGANFVYSF
jgi:hypothetical protein